MMTSTPPTSQMTRAEVNRRMVAGELTPAAARDATIDLYRADPASAAHLAAPDQESGEPWDATAPALSPKVGRRPGKAGPLARPLPGAPDDSTPAAGRTDDPDPTITTLGAYLVAAREEKGLTRTQLGTALGIQSGVVKAYEQGARRPSPFMAPRLAEALDVDPDFLRALVEAQERPRATSRRGTRRAATSRGKGTGKTRGTGTAPRTTAARKRARIVPDQPTPMTLPTTIPAPAPPPVAVPPVLPRLAWQDACYRIVQLRESARPPHGDDDEDGLGLRPYVIEREDGHDALGATRWQQVGSGDEGAWMRATHHLMRVLAEGVHGATGWAGEVGHE